jgi:hypothetical protein
VAQRHNNMGIKMTRIAGMAAGLLLAVGLAACDDDKPSTEDPAAGSSASQSSEDEQSPSNEPSDGASDDSGKETQGMTLSGKISSGVEAGCVLLEQDGKTYNLVGGDKKILVEGAQVEVTGAIEEGLMTTCQQGTPFKVESVKAA